jgi:hypothetical protein
MPFWTILKNLNWRQIKSLLLLFFKKPLFVYPTIKATILTYSISEKRYPKGHQKNGRANAFRHCLWNVLICFYCYKWNSKTKVVVSWAKLVTDWHEKFSPNRPLDKAMDLHNNRLGRNLFLLRPNGHKTELIAIINDRTINAKIITSISKLDNYFDNLVYISDDL